MAETLWWCECCDTFVAGPYPHEASESVRCHGPAHPIPLPALLGVPEVRELVEAATATDKGFAAMHRDADNYDKLGKAVMRLRAALRPFREEQDDE